MTASITARTPNPSTRVTTTAANRAQRREAGSPPITRARRDNRPVAVRRIEPGQTIGARRGEIVVCIPVYRGHEQFLGCLDSVLAHTPVAVRILICDDASPDRRSQEHAEQIAQQASPERELLYMRRESNVGFPATANDAFAAAAPADVVLLNSDTVVAAGWLAGLREAAYVDPAIATATPLTNHGTILSVPERGVSRSALSAGWSIEDAAATVRARSLRLRPRLLTAVGHCVYVRRSALELAGGFDLAFSPGYGEEVDFSQRCLAAGLLHVAADEVLVFHHGGASFSVDGAVNPIQAEHEQLIAKRYPYYHGAVRAGERDHTGPLPRALSAARRALIGLSVVIDPRVGIAGPEADVDGQVNELVAALARLDGVRVAVASAWASASSPGATARPDVVHRLFGVSDLHELASVGEHGERLIVSHPSLLGYHNPARFGSLEAWERHRSLTRACLGAADHIVFATEGTRNEALAEDLVTTGRSSVVPPGVGDPDAAATAKAEAPPGADRLAERQELLLVIADDLPNEHRVFALELLEQLQRRHGWKGTLVLVGRRAPNGAGSAAEEPRLLSERPEVRDAVLELGELSEPQRHWLLGRASLLLHLYGDGRWEKLPWQAARLGVPSLWAPGTAPGAPAPSVGELAAWESAASAERAFSLLTEAQAREANLAALRIGASSLTWAAAAERLVEIYHAACDAPPVRATSVSERQPTRSSPPPASPPAVSEDGLRLVGPGGALPAELERPLLALATHRRIARPMFAALRAGYWASHRLRRRARRG